MPTDALARSTSESAFRTLILPFTLHEEGGYSKDREDPGNWTGGKVGVGAFHGTKYGIAANSHPKLDIVNLTVAQASDIYWQEYMPQWIRGLDPALAMVIFDCGVNCGLGVAKRVLAASLKAQGLDAQIKTATAANLSFHRSLRTWGRYGKVWGGRIARCQTQAVKIEAGEKTSFPEPTETSVVMPAPSPDALEPQAGPQAASAASAAEPQEAKGSAPATTIAPKVPEAIPESPKTLGEVLVDKLKGLFSHGG
jgi:lysozyme family protein